MIKSITALRLVIFGIFFLHLSFSFAGDKYWITFRDKDSSSYLSADFLSPNCIENRKTHNIPLFQYSDIPVNTTYTEALQEMNIAIHYRSRWFNSVSASLTPEEAEVIKNLPFVEKIAPFGSYLKPTIVGSDLLSLRPDFSKAISQMEIGSFKALNTTGKGVNIGIIDAGFKGADSNELFSHIFAQHRVKGTRDFLNPEVSDFYEGVTSADYHGKNVWKMVAGYDSTMNKQYGMALDANFYLARTESGDIEARIEEDAWVSALEWLDSLGVRLVNSSLGYSEMFDNPAENYTTAQMNGNSSVVARAANLAVRDKGMVVVVSAGNEGNIDWKIVSTPGDAPEVISVGALKSGAYMKAGYSSIGPDFVDFTKPDVACYSTNGTSYAAPAITGFIACLMSYAPHLSNDEIKKVLLESSHLYPFYNNFIGYGVPKASRAIQLMDNLPSSRFLDTMSVHTSKEHFLYSCSEEPEEEGVVFHKLDHRIALSQRDIELESRKKKMEYNSKLEKKVIKAERKKLKKSGNYVGNKYYVARIDKPEGCKQSTLQLDEKIIEIYWEE